MSEPETLRHRIGRLKALLPFVTDSQARHAIDELIGEANERLEHLTQHK